MRKRCFGLLLAAVFVFLLSGCGTSRGVSCGLSQDIQSGTDFIMSIDNWMKKNLW